MWEGHGGGQHFSIRINKPSYWTHVQNKQKRLISYKIYNQAIGHYRCLKSLVDLDWLGPQTQLWATHPCAKKFLVSLQYNA